MISRAVRKICSLYARDENLKLAGTVEAMCADLALRQPYSIYKRLYGIELQGSRDKIRGYLRKGYRVKDERNGYWILFKPAQIVLTLMDNTSECRSYGVKQKVLEFYDKKRISEKTFNKFLNDSLNGKIKFCISEHGEVTIQRVTSI